MKKGLCAAGSGFRSHSIGETNKARSQKGRERQRGDIDVSDECLENQEASRRSQAFSDAAPATTPTPAPGHCDDDIGEQGSRYERRDAGGRRVGVDKLGGEEGSDSLGGVDDGVGIVVDTAMPEGRTRRRSARGAARRDGSQQDGVAWKRRGQRLVHPPR